MQSQLQGKGKFTAKTAQKKKEEKKACVDTKILQKESQPNTLKRLEGDKAPGFKPKKHYRIKTQHHVRPLGDLRMSC